jgi:hypothetical protein
MNVRIEPRAVPITAQDAIDTINAHIPSLTDANDEEITERVARFSSLIALDDSGYTDVADLALRTCACGVPIDGFYQYVDHLVAVFGGESHIGG